MEGFKKPLLGVMPRNIWEEKRLEELATAMERYLDANLKFPKEWLEEYMELMQKYAK
jgi:hypothetical protein